MHSLDSTLLDDMGKRVDELEHSINDLMKQVNEPEEAKNKKWFYTRLESMDMHNLKSMDICDCFVLICTLKYTIYSSIYYTQPCVLDVIDTYMSDIFIESNSQVWLFKCT